ncbi:MAG: hypothetical protein FWE15_32550, partial [Actinomycetia bacterium]|nr:hypothetical protein [Actinomycetes bacterium]
SAASSLTGTVTTGIGKNLVLNGLGARLYHRQGFGDFIGQFTFKLPEKMTTWALTSLFRADLHPAWYLPQPAPVPAPVTVPAPAPGAGSQGSEQP